MTNPVILPFSISCRIFLCSLTLSSTSSFLTWSVQLTFSILLQHHISKLSVCNWYIIFYLVCFLNTSAVISGRAWALILRTWTYSEQVDCLTILKVPIPQTAVFLYVITLISSRRSIPLLLSLHHTKPPRMKLCASHISNFRQHGCVVHKLTHDVIILDVKVISQT